MILAEKKDGVASRGIKNKQKQQGRQSSKRLRLITRVLLAMSFLSSLLLTAKPLGRSNKLENLSQDTALSSRPENPETNTLLPNFIETLPTVPVVFEYGCAVKFSDPRFSFCIHGSEEKGALHSFQIDVVTRLLEHRFECVASGLRIHRIVNDERGREICVWVQATASQQHLILEGDYIWGSELLQLSPALTERSYLVEGRLVEQLTKAPAVGHPAYLLAFLYQDFYPLPIRKEGVEPTYCFAPDPKFEDQEILDLSYLNTTKRLLLSRHWRVVLQEARFCDYIGASSVEGLIVADSIGVPAMIVNKAASIKRTLHYESGFNNGGKHMFGPIEDLTNLENYPQQRPLHTPALDLHNASLAQAIAESFPFELFSTRVPALQKNVWSPAEAISNKTLVIVIGSLRGGEVCWKSMYRNLLDENNADLALMIGNISTSGTSTSIVSSMYKRAKHVWAFPEYDDWSDAIDQIDGSQEWRKTLLPNIVPKRAGTLGGADGRPGSGAIIYMARYWVAEKLEQLNLTARYERFVITRSDHYYSCAQDLSKLDARYMWVPTGEDYGIGITDRHLICNQGHILKALDVLPTFVKNPTRLFKNKLNVNPESFLRFAWTIQSLWPHQIRRFPRTMFVVAVSGDGTRWGRVHNNIKKKTNLVVTADGEMTIKYRGEYDFANCFCNSNGVATSSANGNITLLFGHTKWNGFTNARQQWDCTIQ